MDELRGKMQSAMTSITVDLKDEICTRQALETSKESELQAYKAKLEAHKVELANYKTKVDAHKARIVALEGQLELCIAVVTNGDGPVQVSTTPKGNALQTLTYNGAMNAREIDNFFWKLEGYFGAIGTTDEGLSLIHI